MPWKKDLASIKHQFRTEPEPPPKPTQPKKPDIPARSIAEEDAMFLAAMGGRTRAVQPPRSVEVPLVVPPPREEIPSENTDFGSVMESLTGLKRLGAPTPILEASPKAQDSRPIPPEPTDPEPSHPEAEPSQDLLPPPLPPDQPASALPTPRQIQLAAGMAVDVDGMLDLRNHSVADALERLRERVQDGLFLGWRTLHVQLGANAELQKMFEEFLSGKDSIHLLQFAQAPIPMGGAQAWILYFKLA